MDFHASARARRSAASWRPSYPRCARIRGPSRLPAGACAVVCCRPMCLRVTPPRYVQDPNTEVRRAALAALAVQVALLPDNPQLVVQVCSVPLSRRRCGAVWVAHDDRWGTGAASASGHVRFPGC